MSNNYVELIPKEVVEYFSNGRKKIVEVIPRENFTLEITFDNLEKRLYDMSGELIGVFSILKNVEKFMEVFIDENGNIAWDREKTIDSTIVWNNRIELCRDSLYINSKAIAP